MLNAEQARTKTKEVIKRRELTELRVRVELEHIKGLINAAIAEEEFETLVIWQLHSATIRVLNKLGYKVYDFGGILYLISWEESK